VDDHKDAELRTLLGPLSELAARRGVTILLIKHINRNAGAQAVHRVTGSSGYVNTVRAAFLVAADEDNGRKLFLPLKCNLAAKTAGLAFRTAAVPPEEAAAILAPFPDLGEEDRARLQEQLFRLEWLGPVDVTADEALARRGGKDDPSDVDRAAEWLAKFLAK